MLIRVTGKGGWESMLTPPTRNHIFLFYNFLRVSSISHTLSAAFRCRKTIENAKDIYNFSKQVVISLQRGDIDVNTSHTKSHFFFTFSNVWSFRYTFLFFKKLSKSPVPMFGARPENLANRMIGPSLFKISMFFVRAWWHRCAPLPREINTLFSFFRQSHGFDSFF